MSGRGKDMLESEWLTSAMESYAAHHPERILISGSFLSTINSKRFLTIKLSPTVHREMILTDDGFLNIRMEPNKNLSLNVRNASINSAPYKAMKLHFYHLKIRCVKITVNLFLETEENGQWLAAFENKFSGKESTKSATPKTPVVPLEQLPCIPVTPPVTMPKSIKVFPAFYRFQQALETAKQIVDPSYSIRSGIITVSVIRKLLETKPGPEDLKATVHAEPVKKPDTRPIKIESGPPKQEKMSFGTEPGRCQSAPYAFNYDDILFGKKAEPQLMSPEKETEKIDGVMQEKEEQKQ